MSRFLIACICAAVVVAVVLVAMTARTGERQPRSSPWLGLNANTSPYLRPLDTFSRHGVVYDRNLEMQAGVVPAAPHKGTVGGELGIRLREDHELGMTPVSVIEYRGYGRAGFEFRSDPEFPSRRSTAEEAQGQNTIAGYVKGFVRSASATLKLVRERYPGMRVVFEAMNEPWGYTTPQYDGAEYARVIAQLLPAAAAAGIPASDIYVGATGEGCTGTGSADASGDCSANAWVPDMYATEPALRDQIQGWYLHPYGPPSGLLEYDNGGIESLPVVRGGMLSGRDNVIVSEVGFCANDVNNPSGLDEGVDCHGTSATDGATAAGMLTAMLTQAGVYHREGWLKALMVYSRNDGGWAMQVPGGALTPSGEALVAFAKKSSG